MAEPSDNNSNEHSDSGHSNTDTEPTQLAQFETSLDELETLVEALEAGNISLEEALAKFERGVTLTRQCRDLLKQAELRVDQLMADGDQVDVFPTPED